MLQVRVFSRGVAVVLALMLLAGLLPLAVGAADPSPGPDPRLIITRLGDQPPAAAPVSAAPAAPVMPAAPAVTLQSFHFSAQGKITVRGTPGDISLTINGEFAAPDRLHATVTVRDSASTATIPPIELVVVGSKPYVHLTGSTSPTGKDVWVLIDNPDGMTMLPVGGLPNLASLLPVSTQTQMLGDETINGTLATHMRTTVDATALLGGAAKNAKPSMLTVDVWAGKADKLPRRVGVNGNLSIDPSSLTTVLGGAPSGASAMTVDATITFTVDLTDLNAPVTISAPATFVKLSDVLNQ